MTKHYKSKTGALLVSLLILLSIAGCTITGTARVPDPHLRKINRHALWSIEQGLWKEARTVLEQAAIRDSTCGGIYNNLGIVYEFLGDNSSADQAYQNALRLLPTNQEIQQNYEQFLKYREVLKEYNLSMQGLRTLGEALSRWSKSRTFRFEIRRRPLVLLGGMRRLGIISYQKSSPKGLGGRKDFSQDISDRMRHVLQKNEALKLVPDHEMRWALNVDRWDSTTVKLENLVRIRDKIDIDGLIILEMAQAGSRVTPGGQVATVISDRQVQIRTRSPRFNIHMDLKMSIVNLDSMKVVWQKDFQEALTFRMGPGFSFSRIRGGIGQAAIADMAESIAEEFKYYLQPGGIEVEKKFMIF